MTQNTTIDSLDNGVGKQDAMGVNIREINLLDFYSENSEKTNKSKMIYKPKYNNKDLAEI